MTVVREPIQGSGWQVMLQRDEVGEETAAIVPRTGAGGWEVKEDNIMDAKRGTITGTRRIAQRT